MTAMTITEALAEIQTIGKRVQKKEQFVHQYAARQDQMRDPFEKDGGSAKVIAQELQGISDLRHRIVKIRRAVQQANLVTLIKIGELEACVTDWLTWRKEVAPGRQAFYSHIQMGIQKLRNDARAKGVAVQSAVAISGEVKPTDVIVNIDEKKLHEEMEALENTIGVLDGKLSLVNATTTIEIED